MYRPVRELLTKLFAEVDFEERFAEWAGLAKKELEAHQKAQAFRRREALRLEMELIPDAVRWVSGLPVIREEERLDIAKACELGVLHLAEAIKRTKFGMAVELYDGQHAREMIGEMYGLWREDDDGGGDASGLDDFVKLMPDATRSAAAVCAHRGDT
ncbi:hypothetical protein [Deinococcus hopiensis]|uniref:Uncharacterized protein n=1 Tax=Deinococcus hopiensis KR-140 TaxID=695939 RepID=A0A1W1VD92_9DEIO|nr:hypothetical protein [Deinococcus hopiensis]SMB91170.1 hypothetical protein SAMN00790413_01017 [Deinococcus hopiensis KR-140]